mgnify:CR=1 FL=1
MIGIYGSTIHFSKNPALLVSFASPQLWSGMIPAGSVLRPRMPCTPFHFSYAAGISLDMNDAETTMFHNSAALVQKEIDLLKQLKGL